MEISKESLEIIKQHFDKDPNIILVYFFGSQIKGLAVKNSDLDVAVVAADPQKVNYQAIYTQLIKAIANYDIDLRIVSDKLSPLFLFEVLKEGRCVYQKSEDQRIGFATKVLRDFYDSQHIRNIYDSYLKKSLEEGSYGHK